MKRLLLTLYDDAVTHVPAQIALVVVPEDERPLQGDAGRIDWRLVGGLSRMLLSGFVRGRVGEAGLCPIGPRLAADRMLLFGVGPVARLSDSRLEKSFRQAAMRIIALGMRSAVLALPGCIDLAREGEVVLAGLIRGVAAGRGPSVLDVGFADGVGLSGGGSVARAVERASEHTALLARDLGVEMQLRRGAEDSGSSVVTSARASTAGSSA